MGNADRDLDGAGFTVRILFPGRRPATLSLDQQLAIRTTGLVLPETIFECKAQFVEVEMLDTPGIGPIQERTM
jgi:hypothetical protein